jgi:hypothetical protein
MKCMPNSLRGLTKPPHVAITLCERVSYCPTVSRPLLAWFLRNQQRDSILQLTLLTCTRVARKLESPRHLQMLMTFSPLYRSIRSCAERPVSAAKVGLFHHDIARKPSTLTIVISCYATPEGLHKRISLHLSSQMGLIQWDLQNTEPRSLKVQVQVQHVNHAATCYPQRMTCDGFSAECEIDPRGSVQPVLLLETFRRRLQQPHLH